MKNSDRKKLHDLAIDLRQMAGRAAALAEKNELQDWRSGYDYGRHVAYMLAAREIEAIVGEGQ